MKKLMFAMTVAIGLSVYADEWFDTKIDTYTEWPTNNVEEFKGTWSNAEGAKLESKKLTVSANADTPLTFEATVTQEVAKAVVTVTSTLDFTPFTTLPAVPAEAKAGVISFITGNVTNFYVIASNGTENVWTDSKIEAKDSAIVKVTFIDADTAVYDIDGEVSTNDIVAIEKVSKVCMSGDGAIAGLTASFETKSVGPQTPPTGGGAVEPVEGEPGTYVVTPSPEGNVTIIPETLKDTDIIRITTPEDVNVSGVPAKQIEVKLGDKVIPNAAFVGGDDKGFSTALNPAGEVQVESETIKVKPELSNAEDAVKPFVLDETAKVGAKTIPGLTYTLIRQSEVTGGTSDQADQKVAESARTELEDKAKPADKAFYIIQVTK